MSTHLTMIRDDVEPFTLVGSGGGDDDPPIAVAMPWNGDDWAIIVQPDSPAAALASAVRRLPAGCRFVEAYGDVETVLVYRPAGRAEQTPPLPAPPPHPLALVRAARGWTYQALARRIADRSRALGINMAAARQKPYRWEHNGVVPDRFTQLLLADELGVPRERTALDPWPAWLPVPTPSSYEQIVQQLTVEIENGIRALAALGYTAEDGAPVP